MTKVKVTSVGNSVGIVLPKEVLTRLRIAKGDTLSVIETTRGVELTAYDPEFERPASCSGWRAAWPRRRPSIPSATSRFEKGLPVEKILSTFPAIDTAVDGRQNLRRASKNRRQGDGPRHPHPLARPAGSRHDPALAPPIPLAHRLRAAADGRRPPHRRVDGEGARSAQPGDARLHQHRPALEGVGESEELKAFTTGGFFGSEFGPFNLPDPDEAARRCARPQGHGRRTLRQPLPLYRKLVDAKSRTAIS
jgi:putative addiction module antidote